MSIRTKLLAAIVGLNGTILILAWFLFMRIDPQRQTSWQGRAELERLAATVPREGELEEIVQRQLEKGLWDGIYVVVSASSRDADKHPQEVYAALEWLGARAEQRRGEQIQGRLREDLSTFHGQAVRAGPIQAYESGALAVIPAANSPPARPFSVIALPVSSRWGAQTLYFVMIAGVILLTAVSFWLVSRLVIDPLGELSDGAERVAQGDFGVRLQKRGSGDEIDRTISAFNRMAAEVAEYQGHLEDRVLTALARIKNAEQHLAIAQRLAATGKLAAGLAHEINNPLGGMKNATRALARGDLDEEKTTLYLELISDGLQRVEQTVKRFLSFTPRNLEPRTTNLGDVVGKALGLADHKLSKGKINVSTELAPEADVTVFGDPHELQQVILNLLLNAGDAARSDDASGQVRVKLQRIGDEVVLAISDNGHGMSPEDQAHCFDMFFTTKAVGEGTGLGLAVVHNIITNHGGRIEVSSELGQGSVFSIHLPADAGTPTEAVQEEAASP
ncbi:MAG: HAMP domain-containing histidine kinase [bacterium]|nr:HAMP domain-containing histidine kinase [bacterium]